MALDAVTVTCGGYMTVSNLCRLTVQTYHDDRPVAVDLALPTGLELCELIPSVVDVIGDGPGADNGFAGERWTLTRLNGSVLNESMTLHENGVRNGDILLLCTAPPHSETLVADLCHSVVDASPSAGRNPGMASRLSAIASLCTAGCGAVALACGSSPAVSRAVVAAMVAVAAIAGSIGASRLESEPLPSVVLGVIAAAFAAVAGFLVVPGGPAPPNLFLAAAICAAASMVLLYVNPCGATCFIAVAAFAGTTAIAAGLVAIWPAPAATVGAILAAISLALSGLAARLSIAVTGLSPTMPSAAGDAVRARRGHQTYTGLLAGFSASAASGVVLMAADQSDESTLSGVVFTSVVSAVLLLQARRQRGLLRCAVVFGSGMVSASATFALTVLFLPRHAHWLCLIAVVLGVGAMRLSIGDVTTRFSPVVRRGVDVLDYVAVASVIPLTCWVADVFGIVRGLSLT